MENAQSQNERITQLRGELAGTDSGIEKLRIANEIAAIREAQAAQNDLEAAKIEAEDRAAQGAFTSPEALRALADKLQASRDQIKADSLANGVSQSTTNEAMTIASTNLILNHFGQKFGTEVQNREFIKSKFGTLGFDGKAYIKDFIDRYATAKPTPIDPETPAGYAQVMTDPALQEEYQDVLDHLFGGRIVDVRNALRGLGWTGENRAKFLNKGDASFQAIPKNVGAGANMVAVTYTTTFLQAPAIELVDDLTKTPAELAAQIDAAVPVAASVPGEKFRYGLMNRPFSIGTAPKGNVGFAETPLEHQKYARHGVVIYDRRLTPAEVYQFELSPIIDGDEARNAVATAFVRSIGEYAPNYAQMSREGASGDVSDMLLPLYRSWSAKEYGGPISAGLWPEMSGRILGALEAAYPATTANPAPAPAPTYEFTDATDAFRQAATSGGSDFATAEKMDAKAKELGLKVSWSTGKALLDSATGEPDDDEDDDGEDDDFDAEDEWDATPKLDSCGGESKKPLLDGDFKGHPFRGNKYRKAGHSSSAAVGSSIRAKTAERKGSAKEVKAAHKEAHYAHMAASIGATGKTKRYHRKMAKLHGQRGGVKGTLDSAADGLAVENALTLAAGFFGGTVVLDSAATVSHAVAQLQVALSVVENNEPINRASGYVTQADLERDSAQDFRSAIAILKERDRGATLDSVTGDLSDEDEDGDSMEDDEDFDAEQEWDAVPELDSCGDEVPKPILDGDFKGHPFHGNQYKKAGHSSRAAVGSTLQAKTIERKGGTKKALKAAHKEAYYSHRAAAVSASGKTKRYHKKMAKFHAGRSGVEVLDSAVILDAAAGPQSLIGKVKKGVKIIGRISIGGDGKAMIFTGNAGKERVNTDEGKPAIWADDEATGLLDYLMASLPPPAATSGAMPIAKRNKMIDDFQRRQDSLSEGYKAIRELFKAMSAAKSAGKDVSVMAAADFAKAGDLLKSGQVTQAQYNEFAALYSETSGVPVPAPTEDPQVTQDRALFQSVIDGTVTTPDGEGILSATLADTLEAAYMRHAGNADMDALFEKAINAYTEAEVAASANL